MRLVRSLFGWMGTLFFVGCAATVTAQFVGVVILSSKGMLTRDKVVRYAGVLYGVDPLDMSGGEASPEDAPPSNLSPEEALADRVKNSPQIKDRQSVIRKGTDDIRGLVMGLKFKRERQAELFARFKSNLETLEVENNASSLREIQITLEALPAKQAKDIIAFMLEDAPIDPDDDAMADVVTLVKAMPPEKLKKIFGEFKSDNERELLHRILVEIGNLDERDTQLTGTQP
jgi:hypothetical protein